MDLFANVNPINKKCLTDAQLCFLEVQELKELFKSGDLSSIALLMANVRRIEAEDAKFNCITQKHYEDALAQAQESERRYKNGTPRPLEGITVAIKDEVRVAGWRTTYGSLICREAPVEPEVRKFPPFAYLEMLIVNLIGGDEVK